MSQYHGDPAAEGIAAAKLDDYNRRATMTAETTTATCTMSQYPGDPAAEGITMAGTLRIRITKASGEIHDIRYRYMWSAWLDGRLLGNGHCFKPEEGIARAHDLVSPEEVEHIEIREA